MSPGNRHGRVAILFVTPSANTITVPRLGYNSLLKDAFQSVVHQLKLKYQHYTINEKTNFEIEMGLHEILTDGAGAMTHMHGFQRSFLADRRSKSVFKISCSRYKKYSSSV